MLMSPCFAHSAETKDNGKREESKSLGEKEVRQNVSKQNQNTTKNKKLTKKKNTERFHKPKVCCRVILRRRGISSAMESIKNCHYYTRSYFKLYGKNHRAQFPFLIIADIMRYATASVLQSQLPKHNCLFIYFCFWNQNKV